MQEQLFQVDPESAKQIHANNIKRVIRALEYYHQTQKPISKHNQEQQEKESPYRFVYFVLNREREKLYQRIHLRVDQMIKQGFVEEVASLLEKGYSRDLTSMQGLGYKEIAASLEGEISLKEAIEKIKTNTRHFAKRQLTWFRREKDVTWVEMEQYQSKQELCHHLFTVLKEHHILENFR